ncbi:uncharacterized protein TNCV_784731 [Trichonephila clavipes]|nr:uncharacterized protein TNCV_784731 [Trichonephila clavipes]
MAGFYTGVQRRIKDIKTNARICSLLKPFSKPSYCACSFSGDRVTTEFREIFQQLQNPAQKYAFLRPGRILSLDKLNLDRAPQHINKEEFQFERKRLQASVAATEPGCKNELIRYVSLGFLKYIIEPKLEDAIQNIVIMCDIPTDGDIRSSPST